MYRESWKKPSRGVSRKRKRKPNWLSPPVDPREGDEGASCPLPSLPARPPMRNLYQMKRQRRKRERRTVCVPLFVVRPSCPEGPSLQELPSFFRSSLGSEPSFVLLLPSSLLLLLLEIYCSSSFLPRETGPSRESQSCSPPLLS